MQLCGGLLLLFLGEMGKKLSPRQRNSSYAFLFSYKFSKDEMSSAVLNLSYLCRIT